jgi:hypothetical protein
VVRIVFFEEKDSHDGVVVEEDRHQDDHEQQSLQRGSNGTKDEIKSLDPGHQSQDAENATDTEEI